MEVRRHPLTRQLRRSRASRAPSAPSRQRARCPGTTQRYIPPLSLPWTKTNEIHVPVDVPADVPADGGAPTEGATAPAAVSA